MKQWKQRLSALVVAVVLAGCGVIAPADPVDAVPSPPVSPKPATEEAAPTAPQWGSKTTAMLELAGIYERFCQGSDTSRLDWKNADRYPLGWLATAEQLGDYRVGEDDLISLPWETQKTMLEILLGAVISPEEETVTQLEYFFSPADFAQALPYTLTPTGNAIPSPDQKGRYLLTCTRDSSETGYRFRDVTYTFMPYVFAEEPPAPFAARYQKGDQLWRLVEVKNEVLPAPTVRTIELSSVADLEAMIHTVNSGEDVRGITYRLTADLDCGGKTLSPIGLWQCCFDEQDPRELGNSGFAGNFDGGGHTISNLVIAPTLPQPYYGTGFFADIDRTGVVKNLTLEGVTVTAPQEWGEEGVTTQAAGILAGRSRGRIEHCHVRSSTVEGHQEVGGLVGVLQGDENAHAVVSHCTVDAIVTASHSVGTFVGTANYADISGCTALGEVSAVAPADGSMPQGIGGFAGSLIVGTIENSISDVIIKTMVPVQWAGAFAAYQDGEIRNSYYNIDKAPLWEIVGAENREWLTEVSALTGTQLAHYREKILQGEEFSIFPSSPSQA